jgi:signal transduction histidine kinase
MIRKNCQPPGPAAYQHAVVGDDSRAADGIGSRPHRQRARLLRSGGSFGLIGLRDRVHAPSGSIEVDSRPGEGTAIVAELPLQPD